MISLWLLNLGFLRPKYEPVKKINKALIDNNALEKNKPMISRKQLK